MTPFTQLRGAATPMAEDNIDTDIIFPARFLLITARDGLGQYAFHDRRFDAEGQEIADFILNRDPWRTAPILIAGANFGSGSSREQAVWALVGQGIRCVVAPGFGEIFHGNCFRNGVLPIVLPEDIVAVLSLAARQALTFTVDLEAQTLSVANWDVISFDVGREHRLALLNGWDETDQILDARGDEIAAFETRHQQSQPWLFDRGTPA
jgi:3-isopropylmalate/(R)-2-methylmalate dehydratase small subunit